MLPLLLHCAHRHPELLGNTIAVQNSLVHEIDVLRWLLSEDYATAEVRSAYQQMLDEVKRFGIDEVEMTTGG